MGKYAQMVMGPAGVGKSTYCAKLAEHCATVRRRVHVVNLDPAAEDPLAYGTPAIDVRDLVRADDVAADLGYGPNGALLYAMTYLVENVEWLLERLGDYDDDYLIFDCPGQLELYSHVPVVRTLVDALRTQAGYSVVGLYLIDAHFLADPAKFVSGALACLSAMTRLELPHINVLSKMDLLRSALPLARPPRRGSVMGSLSCGFFGEDHADLLQRVHERDDDEDEDDDDDDDDVGDGGPDADVDGSVLERYVDVDVRYIMAELEKHTGPAFARLNEAICGLLEDFSMVSFAPLDVTKRESLETLLLEADNAIQYGEDEEPRDPDDEAAGCACAAGDGDDGEDDDGAAENGVDPAAESLEAND